MQQIPLKFWSFGYRDAQKLFAFAFAGVAAFAGCTPGESSDADDVVCDEEPQYGGESTDEVWYTLRDASSRAISSTNLRITSPTQGSIVDASTPPVLAWADGTVSAMHEPPVTGDTYLVEIDVGEDCFVELVTTEMSITPTASVWSKVANASGDVTMRVVHAYLDEGRIDGDADATSTVTFRAE